MRALVVSVVPVPDTLGDSLRRVAVDALLAAGHEVEESDLCAMRWNPVLDPDADYGAGTADVHPLTIRAAAALEGGSLAADVVAEQEKIARADVVVFVFPLWWFGPPAILKGWFERVWVQGFAFGTAGPGGPRLRYGDGGLVGKRAFTIVTAGDRTASLAPRGVNGDIAELLFPLLHGTFWYCGMEPLEPVVVSGVGYPGWRGYDDAVAEIRSRLGALDEERRIPYRSLRSGDYGRDRLLRDDIRPGDTGLDIHTED